VGGLIVMAIGVLTLLESAVAALGRGLGVLVTLIGMVSLIAARQSAMDVRTLSRTNAEQHQSDS
jgi:hypothetical protein